MRRAIGRPSGIRSTKLPRRLSAAMPTTVPAGTRRIRQRQRGCYDQSREEDRKTLHEIPPLRNSSCSYWESVACCITVMTRPILRVITAAGAKPDKISGQFFALDRHLLLPRSPGHRAAADPGRASRRRRAPPSRWRGAVTAPATGTAAAPSPIATARPEPDTHRAVARGASRCVLAARSGCRHSLLACRRNNDDDAHIRSWPCAPPGSLHGMVRQLPLVATPWRSDRPSLHWKLHPVLAVAVSTAPQGRTISFAGAPSFLSLNAQQAVC